MQYCPGSVIDEKFQVLGLLGSGGNGIVYVAEQLGFARKVALKFLSTTAADEESFARMVRESQIIGRLRHKNIVSLYAFGQVDGASFIAMELVEGQTLEAKLAHADTLSVERSIAVAKQICSALIHAHSEGIVHRDLKPANILLDRQGTVKIIDFGLAKLVGNSAEHQKLTREGTAVGTVQYMSPEQCRGEATVDGRADIYSLGCILLHCLGGHPPFEGETAAEVMYKHLEDEPPQLVLANDDTPQLRLLQNVLDRSLEKDTHRRYQTAQEMLSDIDAISLQSKSSPLEVKSVRRAKKRSVNKLAWAAVSACCVSLIAYSSFEWLSHKEVRSTITHRSLNDIRSEVKAADGKEKLGTLLRAKEELSAMSIELDEQNELVRGSVAACVDRSVDLWRTGQANEAIQYALDTLHSLEQLAPGARLLNQKIHCAEVALNWQSHLPLNARKIDATSTAKKLIRSAHEITADQLPVLFNMADWCQLLGLQDEADHLYKLCTPVLLQSRPQHFDAVSYAHFAHRLYGHALLKDNAGLKAASLDYGRKLVDSHTDPAVFLEFAPCELRSNAALVERRTEALIDGQQPLSINQLIVAKDILLKACWLQGKHQKVMRIGEGLVTDLRDPAIDPDLKDRLLFETVKHTACAAVKLKRMSDVQRFLLLMPTRNPSQRLQRFICYYEIAVRTGSYDAVHSISAGIPADISASTGQPTSNASHAAFAMGHLHFLQGNDKEAQKWWAISLSEQKALPHDGEWILPKIAEIRSPKHRTTEGKSSGSHVFTNVQSKD